MKYLFINLFRGKAGYPIVQYIMYNIPRDIAEHCTQYITISYSLILTSISIFVTTHKSLIQNSIKANLKCFLKLLLQGESKHRYSW